MLMRGQETMMFHFALTNFTGFIFYIFFDFIYDGWKKNDDVWTIYTKKKLIFTFSILFLYFIYNLNFQICEYDIKQDWNRLRILPSSAHKPSRNIGLIFSTAEVRDVNTSQHPYSSLNSFPQPQTYYLLINSYEPINAFYNYH